MGDEELTRRVSTLIDACGMYRIIIALAVECLSRRELGLSWKDWSNDLFKLAHRFYRKGVGE